MEVTISKHCANSFNFAKSEKNKAKFKRNIMFSKNLTKEVMSISKADSIQIIGRPNVEENLKGNNKETHHFERNLRDKYLFPDLDLLGMLDDLFEKEIIRLPKPKRLKEIGRTAKPEYYRRHRMVTHPL